MANNDRYTAVVNQIKADLNVTRGSDWNDARADALLTAASNYFLTHNPDGWPFAMDQVTSAAADQSLSVQTDADALGATFTGHREPNYYTPAIWVVKTNLTGASGSWKDLKYRTWTTMSRSPDYNRTATSTANQRYWSVKVGGSSTATKRPTVTIETFPYSYATNLLYYQIDYQIETPVIATGTNADDAFIWEDQAWDMSIVGYIAEAMIAHEQNKPDYYNRAWYMGREFLKSTLLSAGVEEHRIHLPPPIYNRDALTATAA